MTEIGNTGVFRTGILHSVKSCEHVEQLLQTHEAKAQSSLAHTCTKRNAFNKLSMNGKVPFTVMQDKK